MRFSISTASSHCSDRGSRAYGNASATWLDCVVVGQVANFFCRLSLCLSSWLGSGVSWLWPFDGLSNGDASSNIVMSGSLGSWGWSVGTGVAWAAFGGWLFSDFSVWDCGKGWSLLNVGSLGPSVEGSFSEGGEAWSSGAWKGAWAWCSLDSSLLSKSVLDAGGGECDSWESEENECLFHFE